MTWHPYLISDIQENHTNTVVQWAKVGHLPLYFPPSMLPTGTYGTYGTSIISPPLLCNHPLLEVDYTTCPSNAPNAPQCTHPKIEKITGAGHQCLAVSGPRLDDKDGAPTKAEMEGEQCGGEVEGIVW